MAKNYPTTTLCDTRNYYSYEDYVDYCNDMDREAEGENSDAYCNWLEDMRNLEFEDMCDNLDGIDMPCIIIGTLGLWNGNHDICPITYPNPYKAVKKCLGNCDDIKVTLEDGHLNVSAYHHDGTNTFEIHKLSSKGINATKNWEYGESYSIEPKQYWLAKIKGYLY